jgi:hypothetical protein
VYCSTDATGPEAQDVLGADGGGSRLKAPTPPDQADLADGGTEVKTTKSGATIVGGADGEVYLPTDKKGNIKMMEDIFIGKSVAGDVNFFYSSPDIILESEVLDLSGLGENKLGVVFGSDSSCIPGMPEKDCNRTGLIDQTLATAQDKKYGYSCQEKGYEDLYNCPSNPDYRIPVYVAGYTLERYQLARTQDGDLIKDQDSKPTYKNTDEFSKTLTTIDELRMGEKGEVLPAFCPGDPAEKLPSPVEIPAAWRSSEDLYVKLRLKAIVNALQVNRNAAQYGTCLQAWIKFFPEETKQ